MERAAAPPVFSGSSRWPEKRIPSHPLLWLEAFWLGRLRKPLLKSPSLQVTFLLFAIATVGVAVASIGELVGAQMSRSITEGIADTAAASMDVMLADEMDELGPSRPLDAEARADLDAVFSSANDTRINKLLQIRLRNLDGSVLYESLAGIVDTGNPATALAAARQGDLISTLENLPLVAVGPGTSGALPVLKLVMPIHDRRSGTIEATAELYFSAAGLFALEGRSRMWAWMIIALIGVAAMAALFALVDRTGRIIATQRRHLTESLTASQRLAGENAQLRRKAIVANERLLAQVGSDLHDGPLQLLAAHILALSARKATDMKDLANAQQAMEDLRNISAGLVLPELSDLDLRDVIALAVRRHEVMTGASVSVQFGPLPAETTPDLKVCLYRIAQEGLGNAARHGLGGTATMKIAVQRGGVALEIVNGVAETVSAAGPVEPPARPRLGLDGMRARLRAVGGQVTFEKDRAVARLTVYAPL